MNTVNKNGLYKNAPTKSPSINAIHARVLPQVGQYRPSFSFKIQRIKYSFWLLISNAKSNDYCSNPTMPALRANNGAIRVGFAYPHSASVLETPH